MVLAAQLEKTGWEALSEELKKEYKEENGKFGLQVTPVNGLALEDISGLRSSLEKERQNLREANEKLKTFEGIDPTQAKDLQGKLDEMKNWTPEEKVRAQIETQIAEVVKKHESVIAEKDKAFSSLKSQHYKELVESAVTKAIIEAKGSVPLLLPSVGNDVRMVQKEDGTFYSEVINPDGIPRLDGKGEPLSVKALVDEYKSNEQYMRAFDGEGTKGTGAVPSADGGGDRKALPDDADPIARLERAHDANKTNL